MTFLALFAYELFLELKTVFFTEYNALRKGIKQSLTMRETSPCYLVEKFSVNKRNCLTAVFSLYLHLCVCPCMKRKSFSYFSLTCFWSLRLDISVASPLTLTKESSAPWRQHKSPSCSSHCFLLHIPFSYFSSQLVSSACAVFPPSANKYSLLPFHSPANTIRSSHTTLFGSP